MIDADLEESGSRPSLTEDDDASHSEVRLSLPDVQAALRCSQLSAKPPAQQPTSVPV